MNTRAMRRQNFFLDPADWKYQTRESYLARHGRIGAHTPARVKRCERGGDGHPGAWYIFGNSACGHVQVHAILLEHRRIDTKVLRVGPQVGLRSSRRLRHHFAELSRIRESLNAGKQT